MAENQKRTNTLILKAKEGLEAAKNLSNAERLSDHLFTAPMEHRGGEYLPENLL